MFSVTLDGAEEFLREVQAFQADLQAGSERAVEAACKAGAEEAKQVGAFKDRSGDLRAHVAGRLVSSPTGGGAEGEIVAPERYASFVEAGTEAHEIRPKMGADVEGPLQSGQTRRKGGKARQVLRWESGGAVHFAPVVHHPGSKPYPFMGPAYLKAERVLSARMEEEVVKAGERFK